jgi:hypothetical protein
MTKGSAATTISRRQLTLAVLVACAVSAAATTVIVKRLDDEEPADGRGGSPVLVRSAVLGEEREVLVSLPENYSRDASRRYPVLYVLDGSSQSPHTAETARLLARIGAIPEMIVVGIPASAENRPRDYTPPYMRRGDAKDEPPGGADRFLAFLQSELIPYIEGTYRAGSGRMLAGHSRGGLFVVYSLLAKPGLFDARFAYSPALWRDDDRMLAELKRAMRTPLSKATFVYLSLGEAENPKMTRSFRSALETLRSLAPSELRWDADITSGADHSTNAQLSTPVALYKYYRH